MTTLRKLAHNEMLRERMRSAFEAEYGREARQLRERQIAELPAAEWRGQPLRTVACDGDYGRGPHQQNIPEYILWTLLDVKVYRCPFHRN